MKAVINIGKVLPLRIGCLKYLVAYQLVMFWTLSTQNKRGLVAKSVRLLMRSMLAAGSVET